MNLSSASPVLQVADLDKSIAFYGDTLGFTREFAYGDPPFYAGVKRNNVVFHLCSSNENSRRRGMGSVYAFCDEVDSFYQEVTARGAIVTSPLNSHPYGMRDFQIRDIDGNLIGFGAPVDDGNA